MVVVKVKCRICGKEWEHVRFWGYSQFVNGDPKICPTCKNSPPEYNI